MSHFAKIDNNIVTQVIVAEQDFIDTGAVGDPSLWVETQKGVSGTQYAGIGYTYDKTNNVFIEPQPYPSWTLGINFHYKPPTPMPDDGKPYAWNEGTTSWDDNS